MLLAGTAAMSGCSGGRSDYEAAVAETWRHGRPNRDGRELQRELIRYATLAANSHNTQPWRFRLEPDRITLLPDFGRRCPVVDPDDHHLYASLGCATENLVTAAQAHGLAAEVSFDEDEIRIGVEAARAVDSPLFAAIPERQCTRADYDGKPVPSSQLALLEAAANRAGVTTSVFTDKRSLEQILEYVVAGNTVQLNDPAFVEELEYWIRFNESAALRHRDGLFSAVSGNPTMPTWIGRLAFERFLRADTENDKYRQQIRSAAGIIVFHSLDDDKLQWIEVGRSYQRFALQATALGLRHAHINQAVEVPEVRAAVADFLGIGDRRPNLLLRFGYGPLMPRSLRRPVDQVLTS